MSDQYSNNIFNNILSFVSFMELSFFVVTLNMLKKMSLLCFIMYWLLTWGTFSRVYKAYTFAGLLHPSKSIQHFFNATNSHEIIVWETKVLATHPYSPPPMYVLYIRENVDIFSPFNI